MNDSRVFGFTSGVMATVAVGLLIGTCVAIWYHYSGLIGVLSFTAGMCGMWSVLLWKDAGV